MTSSTRKQYLDALIVQDIQMRQSYWCEQPTTVHANIVIYSFIIYSVLRHSHLSLRQPRAQGQFAPCQRYGRQNNDSVVVEGVYIHVGTEFSL